MDSYNSYDEDFLQDLQQSPERSQVLTSQQVKQYMELDIESLMEEACLSFDDTLIILLRHNWNKDAFREIYYSQSQKPSEHVFKNVTRICHICFDSQEIIQMSCGHGYCQSCLDLLISRNKQQPMIQCPDCDYVLPYSFVKQFNREYEEWILKSYIRMNPRFAFCPGVDCSYILQSDSTGEVTCRCGLNFCFKCKTDTHAPVPCDLIQKWNREILKDTDTIDWILKNTRLCPFCKLPVERSMGCNHMLCRPPGGCGKSFCYVCAQPWNTNSHYQCTTVAPEASKQNIAKIYNFYYEKFLNADADRKKTINNHLSFNQYKQLLDQYFKQTELEVEYLDLALKELIDSRNVLKWSYCLGYFLYIQENSANESKLFDRYQQQFSEACEKLAIKIMEILHYIEMHKFEPARIHYPNFIEAYLELKKILLVTQQTCNSYKQNLISAVQNGYI